MKFQAAGIIFFYSFYKILKFLLCFFKKLKKISMQKIKIYQYEKMNIDNYAEATSFGNNLKTFSLLSEIQKCRYKIFKP